jgi:hypothetical protein
MQPEGRSKSLIYWLQPEGGYNPLSLPHPVTLKYKCRPTVTTTIMPLSNYHCCCQPVTIKLSLPLILNHQLVTPLFHHQPDPLTTTCNSCHDHQKHISNHMPNITTSCLYSCTKHLPISPTSASNNAPYHHQDMCLNHVSNHASNHEP